MGLTEIDRLLDQASDMLDEAYKETHGGRKFVSRHRGYNNSGSRNGKVQEKIFRKALRRALRLNPDNERVLNARNFYYDNIRLPKWWDRLLSDPWWFMV